MPDWHLVEAMARRAGALGAIYPAVAMVEKLVPGVLPGALVDASASAAPRSVRRQLERLTPATAHRVVRTSIAERFMAGK